MNLVFTARLQDSLTKRVMWEAVIDTSTWSGKNFVNKNVTKTLYDETYADQLLTSVADRMKTDGAI